MPGGSDHGDCDRPGDPPRAVPDDRGRVVSAGEKAGAVVLRTMKYRETSLIVTLYTDLFGKVSVVVKGARQPKGKYGTVLQPMAHIRAVIYRKEGVVVAGVRQFDRS